MSGSISRWRALGLLGAVLAVLLVASPGYAQNVIKGKVVDKDNQPVEDAKVTILSTENSRKFELKTDKKGEYYQIGVPTGRYTVTVEKDKLGKMQNQANVRGGQPTTLDFAFVPGAGLSDEQRAKNSALQKLFDEGISASQGGDHQTAVAKFTEVSAGMQNCSDCYYNIGTEYTALKNYPEAETAFKKAVELKPDHVEAYNGLANVYNAQKKFDLASEASAKATELGGAAGGAGGSAESIYNQGVIAWNAGKADEAKAQFQAALKADPNHAPSHFQLGMAYLNLGQLPEAKAEFEAYLKIAPTGPNAAQAQGMLNALPK